MVSVGEAKHIIEQQLIPLDAVWLGLEDATGHVLAKDIHSPMDFPPFAQAAMDGYALCFQDWISNMPLHIVGEIAAGNQQGETIQKGQVMRVFTGALVPQYSDTVVMQEHVTVKDGQLFIHNDQLVKGANVRPMGSELRQGDLALSRGTLLSPAAIGFLASMGTVSICVLPKPRVKILVTGSELQAIGQPLSNGQVYESNSHTLRSVLQLLHIPDVEVVHVPDELAKLSFQLAAALEEADIVLVTGGVSTGDYDYMCRASDLCEVEQLFYKVRQKPGKPLFFGRKGRVPVFGLPGNPASVLVCFYEYVVLALEQLTGRKNLMKRTAIPLAQGHIKKAGLTQFLKGSIVEGQAKALHAQESYRLSSFAVADCLICLPENAVDCRVGDEVEVHLLPV